MKIILAFCALLITTWTGFAQTIRDPKTPTKVIRSTTFPHNDVLQYYSELTFTLKDYLLNLEDFLTKDEFESENEFRNRLNFFFSKAKVPKRIYSSAERTSLSNVWLPLAIPLQYDAEVKVFKYNGTFGLRTDSMIYPPYTGEENVVFVSEIPVTYKVLDSSTITLSICLPMEATKARENKEHIRVSFNGTPIRYNSERIYPTGFIFLPFSYAVFNRETGEVFAKSAISEITGTKGCTSKIVPTILGYR